MEQAAPILTVALHWMRTIPMALPEQLGEGLDRDLVNKGLQRLIECDGVGACGDVWLARVGKRPA